ncbi:glycerate kinase [Actinomyces sp. zg296]|uniref:glycerate kinase n=1 Tax=Actinomyces sp. zg296 TaxID=2609289 RepID=UPI00135941DD|nr:glycerate kinase [Actinomyces sp. zg296]
MRVLLAPGAMSPEPGGAPIAGLGLGARGVAEALARGWSRARPDDALALLPIADGGPELTTAIQPSAVEDRAVLDVPGPLGQARQAPLVRLARAAGARGEGLGGATWVLDAASASAVPADRREAGREAQRGSTRGLGEAVRQALERAREGDVLVVGLARAAAHDGGAGLLDALGGPEGARVLIAGRDVVLALADTSPLGGMNGAGQGLIALTGLAPAVVQDLDRGACSWASALLPALAGGDHAPKALPIGQAPGAGMGAKGHRDEPLRPSAWGTGAGGGAAIILRALGARALPGARVMAGLTGLETAAEEADLVITAVGEAYDILADSVVDVVGAAASRLALPAVLVTGLSAVPRGELAAAGIVSQYALTPAGDGGQWFDGGPRVIARRLEGLGERLARTWSR